MPEDFAEITATAETTAVDSLVVDVDVFEGPLDLLLTLARAQKVDLRRVSVLMLAEQYLKFVEAAKRLRIELAADYLVMAAWLAYLKSRLLLPPDPCEEGPSGDELAAHLAFQLQRLEAMRDMASRIMVRDQLGREVFSLGETEAVTRNVRIDHQANILDLMRAYARIKTRDNFEPLHLKRGPVFTLELALERMRGMIGAAMDWSSLSAWLPEDWKDDPQRRRSATAASFAAALELVKSGQISMKQEAAFEPLYLRQRCEKAVS